MHHTRPTVLVAIAPGALIAGAVSFFLVIFLATPSVAHAHQIWIEQDARGNGSKVYFGEYGANLREVSPGRLDKFARLGAVQQRGQDQKELTVAKSGQAFTIAGRAAKGESLVVQDLEYPLITRKDPAKEGKTTRTAWTPAARYVADLRPQTPRLTLDILPTGKTGELQVTFKGQPLPEAKVELTARSGWSLNGETDQAGKVTFTLPWKSGYLAKVHHLDPTPGKRTSATGEEAYEVASYVTTLGFETGAGLTPPPPPAPVKPSPLATN